MIGATDEVALQQAGADHAANAAGAVGGAAPVVGYWQDSRPTTRQHGGELERNGGAAAAAGDEA
jgi:hypothetical protein